MNSSRIVKRSLRYYWRTHLGVVGGAFIGSTILIGALSIGDSVSYSLRYLTFSRLGKVKFVLSTPNRFFTEGLARKLGKELQVKTAPLLSVRGSVSFSSGGRRVNKVHVLGVDQRFWQLGPGEGSQRMEVPPNEVILNSRLARRLGAEKGDSVVVRVAKPSFLPLEAPMSVASEPEVARRLIVSSIASEGKFGRFSLRANQVAPFNAFVPLSWFQKVLALKGWSNLLLVSSEGNGRLTVEGVHKALKMCWGIADSGLELKKLKGREACELRSRRIFLEPPVTEAASKASPGAVGVFTYLANTIRRGERSNPYSIVSAIGRISQTKEPGGKVSLPPSAGLIPPGMKADQIVINSWLAEDLAEEAGGMPAAGDKIELTYFEVGPMRDFEERTRVFELHSVVPLKGAARDPRLMPAFPGISGVANCEDWEAGIPIELAKIREKDESYWDRYRGTPKAFVTLEAGQDMWGNRFGNLTSVRYSLKGRNLSGIRQSLLEKLDPASFGLFFRNVRESGLKASSQALDFGQLFLGLSFFLLGAAVILVGLLFVFSVEQRSQEVGVLLALGVRRKHVRGLFLAEGAVLAFIGTALGLLGGVFYARGVLYALSTVWGGALGTSALRFSVEPQSLALGGTVSFAIALVTVWAALRHFAGKPAHMLLSGATPAISVSVKPKPLVRLPGFWSALVCVAAALSFLLWAGAGEERRQVTAFFIAGILLLAGGLLSTRIILRSLLSSASRGGAKSLDFSGMAVRNTTRRPGRSLAVVGLLACGTFLVIAVGANRRDPYSKARLRSSGTGGFELFADTSVPLYKNPNHSGALKDYGLEPDELQGVRFVPLRVREGEKASCLNVNRAQRPELAGVSAEEFQSRGAFTFVETEVETESPWLLLEKTGEEEDVIPAFGDRATLTWGLHKSIGDTVSYVGERGSEFKVRIVGVLAHSVFQGTLLVSEQRLIERFPSESGYDMFLIDVEGEEERLTEVSGLLSRAFRDFGMALVPTWERLAAFNVVQNTYISIFQALGGLGLLLGSAGLGVVVLRNVLERRAELALLRAVGFRRAALSRLVLTEHWSLVVLGLACGVFSAIVAVLPALSSPGAQVPYLSLSLTILAVGIGACAWTWVAAYFALRGPLLRALRNE